MQSKLKDQPVKTKRKKRQQDEAQWKLKGKNRTQRSRQFAGFKTIWR